ncbi:hypothetical protein SPFM15_00275 [Salmonella phage SPFM15]|nr:hypothetical protein SPFM5_00270 [Salmonella phage SPFM5]VFR13899.1 hypothetical protein SPFM15_00275 [Salmonella phage SPFM15]
MLVDLARYVDSKVLTNMVNWYWALFCLQYNQGNMEALELIVFREPGQTLQNTWHQGQVLNNIPLFFQHPDEEGHTLAVKHAKGIRSKLLAANPLPGKEIEPDETLRVIPVPPLQARMLPSYMDIAFVNIHRAIAFYSRGTEPIATPVYLQRHVISTVIEINLVALLWQYVKGQQHLYHEYTNLNWKFGDGRPRGVLVARPVNPDLSFRDYTPARYGEYGQIFNSKFIQGQDEVISEWACRRKLVQIGNALRLTSVLLQEVLSAIGYAGEPEYEDINSQRIRNYYEQLNRSAGNGHAIKGHSTDPSAITLAAHVKNTSYVESKESAMFSQAELNQVTFLRNCHIDNINLRYF